VKAVDKDRVHSDVTERSAVPPLKDVNHPVEDGEEKESKPSQQEHKAERPQVFADGDDSIVL
jgi:hypothetical protein